MLEYYDDNTQILMIPHTYKKKLKDIPKDTIKIIFKEKIHNTKYECACYKKNIYSKFNKEIE
jgi:tRNA G10  N-methylase Trm11